MNAAEAAAESGIATLVFCLVVAGVIIFILGSVVWWFLRNSMQQTHNRLNAGNKRFEQQDAKIEAIHTNYVHKDNCEKERDTLKDSLEKHEQKLDRMVEQQSCFDRKLSELGGEVSRGFKTMTGLMSELVELGSREEA